MMQPEYSLSLDAVICRRCNVVSPAVDDTCPSCGADREGAIFTSATDTRAAAAATGDQRDLLDLRDTGWLTRLVRRRMVTSYPSLVEPGDALASPERKPARKGLAILISGAVAGIAAGGYLYLQSDAERAPAQSVSTAGAVGGGSSASPRRDDADRHTLARRQEDDAQKAGDVAGKTSSAATTVDASASAATVHTARVAPANASGIGSSATEAVSAVKAAPPVVESKAALAKDTRATGVASASASASSSVPESVRRNIASTARSVPAVSIPAIATEPPMTREASRRAVADAVNLASKRDRATASMATGVVTTQTPSGAVSVSKDASASQSKSSPKREATENARVAASDASSGAGTGVARALPSVTSTAAIKSGTAATSSAAASQPTAALARTSNTAAVPAPHTSSAASKDASPSAASIAADTASSTAAKAAPKDASRSTATIAAATASTTAAKPASKDASRSAASIAADTASSPAGKGAPDAPKPPSTVASTERPVPQPAIAAPHDAPSAAEARTIAAVRQALANRDIAAARRSLRSFAPIQSRNPQIQQLAADVARQERARDSAIASARSCAANHDPACTLRNARRAVALDPRNSQAQAVLKHATTMQADANTAYFQKASALPAPVVPSMTFDGRWSIAAKSASAESSRNDASKSYSLFGWGVPAVSKGRGDAH
ncbi:hypothetical protein QCE47_02715 [Caballeronia sp. LZ025]|uniref:hypothetical protein n=1 Tax=Caballeronia TaxID=1827195 RepID=UPI001FD2CD0D|nr:MULTISPECIES: hypothetical protein [Caballeronia]MDR5731262.1 hypothetical protein [Caballeronia sp. LZ025]